MPVVKQLDVYAMSPRETQIWNIYNIPSNWVIEWYARPKLYPNFLMALPRIHIEKIIVQDDKNGTYTNTLHIVSDEDRFIQGYELFFNFTVF